MVSRQSQGHIRVRRFPRKMTMMSFNLLSTVQSFFRRPHYESDATLFINQIKAARPETEANQLAGRALLWDKTMDRQAWSDYRAGEVEQKPYVYQTNAN